MRSRRSAAKRETALATTCASALVASARAGGVGSRQSLRAAARRFVRRHGRDASYLRWVVRGVATSSVLAVALLGLSAAPAAAEIAPIGGSPFSTGDDIGHDSTVALGDLDGDGDLDVVAGELYGGFVYFKGFSALFPGLSLAATNPLAGQDVGNFSTPSLGDLDADGDLDLVSGEQSGSFVYYENTGTARIPAFVQRTGAANPLAGKSAGSYSSPALGDLDRDGDLDLVAGGNNVFFYFENTGDAKSPAFVARTGSANPLLGVVVPGGIPALGDLDRDGDLDFVSGENFGTFLTFENTGSATSPAFVALTGNANPLAGQDVGSTSAPALGDVDGDGALDVLSGEFDGTLTGVRSDAGRFSQRTGAANPLDGVFQFGGGAPALGDLDADGDRDLVSGLNNGTTLYYENTGSATSPAFIARTGAANPLDGLIVGRSPSLADVDADGDLDLFSGGAFSGTFFYFENTGSAANPAFVARTGAANPLDGLNVGANASPTLGDLDDDADLDLITGDQFGGFTYLENTGSAASPAFVLRVGASNPLHGENVGSAPSPALEDVDRDGDLDALSGASGGAIFYYENTGNAANPAFVLRAGPASPIPPTLTPPQSSSMPALGDLDGNGLPDLVVFLFLTNLGFGQFNYFENFVLPSHFPGLQLAGAANPLHGQSAGSRAAPALADLDRDGDRDLLAGEDLGTFRYFENTGTAVDPAFAARSGAANPMNGRDIGDSARPAFADLDGDGDVDLLSGRLAGDFDYFANTGTTTIPLFAASLANPFGLTGVGSESAPMLGDIDADGDSDVVVGRASGDFAFFENTGDATSPAFLERTGFFNPLYGLDVGTASTPTLADFDGDGDLDLAAGRLDGTLAYFENIGDVTLPLFEPLDGIGNPLGDADLGDRSAPAAADLNGDGTSDLVTGTLGGTFAVRYLPEPAQGLLLGAGLALLGLLDTIRCRRRDKAASATRPAATPAPTSGSGSS